MKIIFQRVDRISQNGDIREHLIDPVRPTGRTTLCGLRLHMTQPTCGNATCKRCEQIAARWAAEA